MTVSLPPIQSRFSGPAPEASADDAAQQLESFFVRRMLAEMRKGVGEGMLDGGYAGKMFQDMLDEAMADQMASTGTLGMAELVKGDLSQGPTRSSELPRIGGVASARHYRAGNSELSAMPVRAHMSSKFGGRVHPVTGDKSFHEGVDLAAHKGSAVVASGTGVVMRAGTAGSYGNLVVIDHGGGLETRYAHLDEVSVKVGQQLAAGEPLGTVGATGRVTGAHLHFEVRRDGKAVDPTRELRNIDKSLAPAQDTGQAVDR